MLIIGYLILSVVACCFVAGASIVSRGHGRRATDV